MTVLVVISILVVVLSPAISFMRARAQKVKCISNLRALYVATSTYIHDNHQWPQIPIAVTNDPTNARRWVEAFRPYGLEQINWVCPSIQDALGAPDFGDPENARVDYYPTQFNTLESSPYKYPKQPWFIETADMHGNGQEILYPDGHIEEAADVVRAGLPTPARH